MELYPDPIELRHILHQNPEASLKEFNTTKLIIESIKSISKDLKILTPLNTGLICEYRVNSGSYLLFRADIDALPITEKSSSKFSSKNGFMHACGHDIHTAILYGLIIEALKQNINKNILFLFQPAEEAGIGAKMILDSSILSNYKVDYAFALHVTDEFPYGEIATRKGTLFSSSVELDINLTGKSSHIVTPDKGISVIPGFIDFVSKVRELEQVKSGGIFFGIGKVSIGEARNILPGNAEIEATIRGGSLLDIQNFLESFSSIIDSFSVKSGINVDLKKGATCPEVIIDDHLFDKLKDPLSLKFPFLVCSRKLTAEDFGYFSKIYPSFYFWLGSREGEDAFGLHSPYFYPSDSIIDNGIKAFLECINILTLTSLCISATTQA